MAGLAFLLLLGGLAVGGLAVGGLARGCCFFVGLFVCCVGNYVGLSMDSFV